MKERKLFLIILLFVGIISCEKDHDSYPVTYSAYMISDYQINVFTKDGDVTNLQLLDEISQMYRSWGQDFESNSFQMQIINNNLSEITYLSDKIAELTFQNEKEENPRIVIKKDDIIYFENQEISQYPFSGYIGGYIYYKDKLEPLYSETFNIPVSSGITTIRRTKSCFYAYEDQRELIIPMYEISGKIYLNTDFSTDSIPLYTQTFQILPVNNMFDGDSLLIRGSRDTIIVQQYNFRMRRNN